jgi:ligand-binding sensor domain-containing protein/serine phosphatase RsbU (regulator of sigma subunit)
MPTDAEIYRLSAPLGFERIDALGRQNIRAIAQDGRGLLWFATDDGLVSFDATRARVYRSVPNDATSLSNNYVTDVEVDAQGKLWVGTEEGVSLYDPNTDRFTRFLHQKGSRSGLSSEGVVDIHRDRTGQLWFAMTGGGLNRLDPTTGAIEWFVEKPLDMVVRAIAEAPDGRLLLGTNTDGLLAYDPRARTARWLWPAAAGADAQPVNAIMVDSAGRAWIGTDGDGLLVLDLTGTGTPVQHRRQANDPTSLSHDSVWAILEDRHGAVWIGTKNGLNRLDRKTGTFAQYLHDPSQPSSLPYPWVHALFADKNHLLWIGTYAAGAVWVDDLRLNFRHHRVQSYTVNSFAEEPDGRLWVGTFNGGLHAVDRKRQQVTHYRQLGQPGRAGSVALDETWISAIHRDGSGTLWLALFGQGGLVRFSPATGAWRQYVADPAGDPDGFPVESLWDIWEDPAGQLWLATWGAGLVRFDPRREVFTAHMVRDGHGLTSDYLYSIYPDPKEKNIVWLGSAKGGLIRFDWKEESAIAFRHDENDPTSLSKDDVTAICSDSKGIVWVGTYGGGLNRLDPATGRFERFTTANSALTSDEVFGVLTDEQDKLWISTNRGGLLHFDPAAKRFIAFDALDGVQADEAAQGAYHKTAGGEMLFGGTGGFNAFHPQAIRPDSVAPAVVLTGVRRFNEEFVLDRPIWTLASLDLSYADSFEIQFAGLAFAGAAKNRFEYKLEGFDEVWVRTDRPVAPFTKLDGGDYTLRVRAANRHGVWSERDLALRLHVSPPPWKTWWAFALYAVGAGLLLLALVLQQRSRIRRLEREGRLAAIEREIELTGAIQTGFLPPANEYQGSRIRLYGFYRPAEACGGDWWWHDQSENGVHRVLVGDVTGHGPGPAMVTAAVATAYRVLADRERLDLSEQLPILNEEVLRVSGGRYQMTLTALEIDERTGAFLFHSAGSLPILTMRPGANVRARPCRGWPLGTPAFQVSHIDGYLEPGERVLIFTDGLTDIAMQSGRTLGLRRFMEIYESTKQLDVSSAALHMVRCADQMLIGPQTDDWTFTIFEWR